MATKKKTKKKAKGKKKKGKTSIEVKLNVAILKEPDAKRLAENAAIGEAITTLVGRGMCVNVTPDLK